MFSLLLLSSAAAEQPAQRNTFVIGVTIGLSEHGRPQFDKLRPYIRLDVKQAYPNNINKFRLVENHHGYLGLCLLGLGVLVHSKTVKLAGNLLVVDDLAQHIFRIQSPVHQLNDVLWQYYH